MKRREFLCGVAASALAAPALVKTVHTFAAASIGSPNAARFTMTMEEFTPDNLAMALLGVSLVKQPNGGWLIKGGERVPVGQSFTFEVPHAS